MAPGLVELSDEALMVRCAQAGPAEARDLVGELARRHLERLAGFLLGITGEREAALDLAQEAFVRVFKYRQRYRDSGRFSTWLYTIGRNLALNELRNRKLRPRTLASESGERDPLSAVNSGGEGPARAAERGDLRQAVRAAILELPEAFRSVVVLCDLEERSYAEAAEILEVPIGTVRSRLSRARTQLEQRLRKLVR